MQGVPLALLVAVIAAGDCAAESATADTNECRAVAGMIEPACNGAICNQGRFTGDLGGRFTSRITSLTPAGAKWQFTGWTRIELDRRAGTIDTLDEGTTAKDARGGPDMADTAEVLVLSDASGPLQDYAGTLQVDGGRMAGKAVPYSGRLCKR